MILARLIAKESPNHHQPYKYWSAIALAIALKQLKLFYSSLNLTPLSNLHAGRGLQPRPKRLMLPLSLKKLLKQTFPLVASNTVQIGNADVKSVRVGTTDLMLVIAQLKAQGLIK